MRTDLDAWVADPTKGLETPSALARGGLIVTIVPGVTISAGRLWC